jgi:hypothetical protein
MDSMNGFINVVPPDLKNKWYTLVQVMQNFKMSLLYFHVLSFMRSASFG